MLWRPRDLTLSNICERLADTYGDAPAVFDEGTGSPAIAGEGTVSYRGLRDAANRLSVTLIRHHDLKKGERVIVACENQANALTAFLALVKAGGVAVPLPLRLPPFMLGRIAENARPALAITDFPRYAGQGLADTWTTRTTGAREVLTLGGPAATEEGRTPLEEELRGTEAFFFPYTMKSGDVVAMYFSERQEGLRGTMISNRSLLRMSGILQMALAGRRKAVGLVAMRLQEVAGLAVMLTLLRAGVGFTCVNGTGRSARAFPEEIRGYVYLGKRGPLEAQSRASGAPVLWINPGVREETGTNGPKLFLDGPVFDETCGWALLRLGVKNRGRILQTPFLPLPANRCRLNPDGKGGLRVKGRTVSFGYWWLLEESLETMQGGWFDTGLHAARHRPFGYDLLR